LSSAVLVSRGLRFRILTPARSKDFVVLKDSEEMLPSKRNVFGVFDCDSCWVVDLVFGSGFVLAVLDVFAAAGGVSAGAGEGDVPLTVLLLVLEGALFAECAYVCAGGG
jgi:hypothetical protein